MKKITLIAALAVMLGGCVTTGGPNSPPSTVFVQIAVDVAVAQVVGTGPDAHVRAANISAIASQALALDTGDVVVITAIEAAVNAKIAALHLAPADALAAQVLTQTLEALINARLGGGTTPPPPGNVTSQTKVAIALVLNDVIQACALY